MVSKDVRDALACVSADCDYETWLQVGMAIQAAGGEWEDWDAWSRTAPGKYTPGSCEKKWRSFRSSGITEATLFKLAYDAGYTPEDELLSFDSLIVEEHPAVLTADRWDVPRSTTTPEAQLDTYLSTLFQTGDLVSYCVEAWQDKDGKWKPGHRQITGRPVTDILDVLRRGGKVEDAIGTSVPEAGAWVRFNPVSGEVTEAGGIRDSFVTDYRFALVESDTLTIEEQYACIHRMQLPVACLVNSGGKSLHAIVRIDAADEKQYRDRVSYLYNVCAKYGMNIDKNDRNPSRLSRMPGVRRGDRMQELVEVNIGAKTWEEWQDTVEDPNCALPGIQDWCEVSKNLPPLEEEIIPGVLRAGHKMMVAAASKAGKSFLMVELAVALSEGLPWLGFQCRKSRVLYVNFEIASASFFNRVNDVMHGYGLDAPTGNNLQIWNLRGKAMRMHSDGRGDGFDKRLIRRVVNDGHYNVIIIDPIYKVLNGDENSAADIRNFCNSLDMICDMTKCCCIYVHHHSKGSKWASSAIDRAAGSGVFGRDADATMDLIEVPLTRTIRDGLGEDLYKCKGFMMTTDLREFEATPPRYFWFRHPLHIEDETGILEQAAGRADGTGETEATSVGKAVKKMDKKAQFLNAVNILTDEDGNPPTVNDLVNYFEGEDGFSQRTVYRYYNDLF